MRSFLDVIKKLVFILDKQQKVLCVLVFILTCLGSVLECVGVSVIIPVVNVILSPETILKSSLVKKSTWLSTLDENALILCVIIGVIVIYLLKNIFFVFLSWIRIKFSCKIQREISIKMLEAYMKQGYQFFLNTSYGELSRGVSEDTSALHTTIYAGFRLLSDMITIILLCIFMFVTDYSLSIAMISVSLLCVFIIYFVFRKKMLEAGVQYYEFQAESIQAVMNALQGIKDVLILRKQRYFLKVYEKNQVQVQIAQCKQTVGAESPAYIIEGLCVAGLMTMIAIKTIIGGEQSVNFIANLAAFALAAFRILPSLGRITSSLNQVMTYMPGVNSVYNNILSTSEYKQGDDDAKLHAATEKEENTEKGNVFNDTIQLKDVSFRYNDEQNNIIENLNLTIKKGQAIAFIGASGAGKSTLVDILLGLLTPQKGGIYMDEMPIVNNLDLWAKAVGYVPQNVFLSSGSILENVAFGESEDEMSIDMVWEALERAELSDFVKTLPDGINTLVGDRGVRLSGGQRQRIAIARALYHRPEIMVLDEATSALDNDTEAAIMSAIDSLQGKVTLIIVAHRLTTVKNCDVIYEVENRNIRIREKKDIFS